LFADRYLWRLSFALERGLLGASDTAAAAHALNLLLHLACVWALFFALSRLLEIYLGAAAPEEERGRAGWRLLPGLAAFLFALHPWASEPVCYVSARNASLGALFVFLGIGLWAMAWRPELCRWRRMFSGAGAILCALAAFSCKENFITAFAGYVLVLWPVFWRRWRHWPGFRTALAVIGIMGALGILAWLGVRASARAGGLAAQFRYYGWDYFFNIQNPIALLTLSDQVPVLRLSLEANHPGWPVWACCLAFAANLGLFFFSLWRGLRWPVLLGVGWFYLHLLPTNSVLPRPDFLAARNVYLSEAGIAVLISGGLIALYLWLARAAVWGPRARLALVLSFGAALSAYWGIKSRLWAECFIEPERVWARSAEVAPDHATVRLNLAGAILGRAQTAFERGRAREELQAALRAEDSATMKYHGERQHAVRHSLALRLLGEIQFQENDMRGAEELLKQSWSQLPSLVTWVDWGSACLSGNFGGELDQAVAEGRRCWPQGWWPLALRGLSNKGAERSCRQDLEAAEAAPDTPLLELRPLQCSAIYELALTQPTRAREGQWLQRLKRLGLPEAELVHLSQVLFSQALGR
jgi:hypothetical protein